MLKLKLQYFGHFMWRIDSLQKDSDAGRDWGQEEKGTTEDEMAGWHHWLDGCGSGWTPGVDDGRPWVLQFMGSQRAGHGWATELNWTERNWATFTFDVQTTYLLLQNFPYNLALPLTSLEQFSQGYLRHCLQGLKGIIPQRAWTPPHIQKNHQCPGTCSSSSNTSKAPLNFPLNKT